MRENADKLGNRGKGFNDCDSDGDHDHDVSPVKGHATDTTMIITTMGTTTIMEIIMVMTTEAITISDRWARLPFCKGDYVGTAVAAAPASL